MRQRAAGKVGRHRTLSILVIVAPQGTNLILTSDVPKKYTFRKQEGPRENGGAKNNLDGVKDRRKMKTRGPGSTQPRHQRVINKHKDRGYIDQQQACDGEQTRKATKPHQTVKLMFLYCTVSTLKPIVGMVVTISPSYK